MSVPYRFLTTTRSELGLGMYTTPRLSLQFLLLKKPQIGIPVRVNNDMKCTQRYIATD